MVGWDWLQDILKRNPSMSVGIPEATILARAQAFNKVQIAGYFNKLEGVFDEFKFTPVQIHNVDKSAASVSNAQSGFAKVNAEIPENGEVTASADVSVNEEVSGLVEALCVETAVISCSYNSTTPEPLIQPEGREENIRSNHDKHASLSQIAKAFIEDLSPTPQVGTPVAKKRRMKKGSQGIINTSQDIALLRDKENETREKEGKSQQGRLKGGIEAYLVSEGCKDILKDPSRVYNGDESNLQSVVFTFGTDRTVTHLSAIYSNKRQTFEISRIIPDKWGIEITLYPNPTSILQPADVAAFKLLKEEWQRGVAKWRREAPLEELTREKFTPILKVVLDD
ncbi:hypothetical protein ILUMI_17023, partial [Ignelater luminosus]